MNTEQELADTRELILLLRKELGVEKVFLVGHSYGTYIGMLFAQRHPELLYAYIGIGQLAFDEEHNHVVQDRWLALEAEKAGDKGLLAALRTGGAFDRESALFRYGGELHRATSFWPLLWTGLRAPEYSLRDVANVRKGVSFTHRYMKLNSISGQLADEVTKVDVPVYFFTGRYDYTDPAELTQRYFDVLAAPKKEMVWFEQSAHFPFYEEPAKFAAEMRRVKEEVLTSNR